MIPPAGLKARLAPLIGKLGSSHDPEVLGAARALGRLLGRHRLTFNDLALALTAEPVTRIVYRDRDRARDVDEWRIMADWCAARAELLTAKEADFLSNMLRLARRPGASPTARQNKWLVDIFERLAAPSAGRAAGVW